MPSEVGGKEGYNCMSHGPILMNMITFIAIAAPLAVLGAIDALASKYGVDTRPGFDEREPIR